jgi:hypothetical protein
MTTKAAPISDGIIQTVLWQKIIEIAFSPKKDEIKSWLHHYCKGLKDFWGIENLPWPNNTLSNSVKHAPYAITIDFNLEALQKPKISLILEEADFIMDHDVDTAYFCPKEHILSICFPFYKNVFLKFTKDHVSNVLDGMIFHTRAHQHLGYPYKDDRHEIRIGGGIDNPFLYLFNLRYQLCPNPDEREREETRLVTLFECKLRELPGNPSTTINAKELFGN